MAKFISLSEDGKSLVDGSYDVEQVTIPNGVECIENQAFANCTKLKHVDIPESVTEIGEAAFYNCKSLTSITFTGNLLKIGESAFAGCTSLKHIGGIEHLESCVFGKNVFDGIGGTRLSTPSGKPIVYLLTPLIKPIGQSFTIRKEDGVIFRTPLEAFSATTGRNMLFYKVELTEETEDTWHMFLISTCGRLGLLKDFNKMAKDEYSPERIERVVRYTLRQLNPRQITTLLSRIGYFDKDTYIGDRTDTDALKHQIDKAVYERWDIDNSICGNTDMYTIERVGKVLEIRGIGNFEQLCKFVNVDRLVKYLSHGERLLKDFQKISLDFLAE